MGLGQHVDHRREGGQGGLFHDERPVQMLAALGGQPQAMLLYHRCNARVDGGSRVQAAVFADVAAHDLTGRTAHYKKITGGGVRSLQQFPGSLRRLLGNQIKIQCF